MASTFTTSAMAAGTDVLKAEKFTPSIEYVLADFDHEPPYVTIKRQFNRALFCPVVVF